MALIKPTFWPLPALPTPASLIACRFASESPEHFVLPALNVPADLSSWAARRQAEYLAGRWCLQSLFKALELDLPVPGRLENGAPDWPLNWTGAISHTHLPDGTGLALAALAPQSLVRAIGIDLEPLMTEATAQRIRRSILHQNELPQVQSSAKITAVFSFKESLYKALQPQLQRFIGFQEVAVTTISADQICFEPQQTLSPDFPATAPRQGYFYWLKPAICLSLYQWLA